MAEEAPPIAGLGALLLPARLSDLGGGGQAHIILQPATGTTGFPLVPVLHPADHRTAQCPADEDLQVSLTF